ncbi:MAG: hypothetical protein IJW62_00885 [Clostridia bacterium]|nr:hypothetical protein [Clostridia bacterium]
MKRLKKWIAAMLGAVLLVLLCCCGKEGAGTLSYQEQECVFTGVCALEDGDYTVQISLHTDGSRELLFLSPETLTGCRYVRDAAGAYSFICADTVFPVAGNPTVETVFGLFALDEADLLSADLEENAGEGLNVLTFSGDVKVYLSSADGLPLRFEHPLLTLTLRADGRQILSPN